MPSSNLKTQRGPLMDTIEGRPALTEKSETLWFDGVELQFLAAEYGTPLYVYSLSDIERRARTLIEVFDRWGLEPNIAYAIKANDTLSVISHLAALGLGADVVSEGELHRAIQAGVPAGKIVFSGMGKTPREHRLAVELGVGQINVESVGEFKQLQAIARQSGRPVRAALRINPDIDAGTLAQITTGTIDSKFGMSVADAVELAKTFQSVSELVFAGLSVHIGSQIVDLAPYQRTLERIEGVIQILREDSIETRAVDIGGGLGIADADQPGLDIEGYAALAATFAQRNGVRLTLEPGRWLVANSGLLLTEVIGEKKQGSKRFVVVDAAMNDLMRPALYDAYHPIVPVQAGSALTAAEVVGPVCESSDVLGRNRLLPPLNQGDLLAILDAGAYGATMSSAYNGRPPAPGVVVHQGRWRLARRRLSQAEMIALDLGLGDWNAPALHTERRPKREDAS